MTEAAAATPALPRIAVLVDAENVPQSCWGHLSETAAALGRVVACRAVCCGAPNGWDKAEGVEVVDLGKETRAPSAADIALSFEAGRMLAEDAADAFVVASGDTGFTGLAAMIVRSGRKVHAAVPASSLRSIAPLSRIATTCFVLSKSKERAGAPEKSAAPSRRRAKPGAKASIGSEDARKSILGPDGEVDGDGEEFLRQAFASARADEDGWVPLASIGSALRRLGCRSLRGKLHSALSGHPAFEIDGPPSVRARARIAVSA